MCDRVLTAFLSLSDRAVGRAVQALQAHVDSQHVEHDALRRAGRADHDNSAPPHRHHLHHRHLHHHQHNNNNSTPPQGRIHRYDSAEALLRAFFVMRLAGCATIPAMISTNISAMIPAMISAMISGASRRYENRKMHLSEKLTAEWSKLDNKARQRSDDDDHSSSSRRISRRISRRVPVAQARFVAAVCAGKLKIANRKKADLVAQLSKVIRE